MRDVSESSFYILAHAEARRRAHAAIDASPDGFVVTVKEPTRNEDQSARFHAMCGDLARCCTHVGRKLSKDQWKVLTVSGHAIATKEGADMVPGLEGEYVNLRERTARMGKKRMASLIDYTQAYGALHGVEWSEPQMENA